MRLLYGILLYLFAAGMPAQAHESRPLYIGIHEQDNNYFVMQWKIPPSISVNNDLSIVVEGCTAKEQAEVKTTAVSATMRVVRQRLLCTKAPSQVLISFSLFRPAVSTIIRLQRVNGKTYTKLLDPVDNVWVVPGEPSAVEIAVDYSKLGAIHISNGIDHLLFLACLIFIAGTGRRTIVTITGFTVAHSITLVLSSLQVVNVPTAPAEAVIALSIVFLAIEIVKGPRNTLTWQHPIAVSSAFGLLHGFGFAAVLDEIGLPNSDLLMGLLFFNLGVEIGQIIFVIAVVVVYKLMANSGVTFTRSVFGKPIAYIVGILASYWMIDRGFGFVVA